MSDRNIAQEILDGLKEVKDFKNGQKKLALSQVAFASLLGVSTRTVQDWEQGRRQPQGPANHFYGLQKIGLKFCLN